MFAKFGGESYFFPFMSIIISFFDNSDTVYEKFFFCFNFKNTNPYIA